MSLACCRDMISHSSSSRAVSKATPFALITQQTLAKEMNADVLSRVDTLRVGVYDDNTLPRHNQHYKKEFINQVSIIKKKQAQQ